MKSFKAVKCQCGCRKRTGRNNSQPAPVSQPEEEEQEQSIEDYLNSLIEFDEKSSETLGIARF